MSRNANCGCDSYFVNQFNFHDNTCKMKESTKSQLDKAYHFCIDRDKSIEYTIQYLQDVANVDLDCVMNYLKQKNSNNDEQR